MNGTHISLFAGVGMTDIAVEAAGFRTVATAEIDPFCRLNPEWVEWLMGLPLGWTDPECSELTPHPGWDEEPHGIARTVPKVGRDPVRSKRIRALGNGLVPGAAAVALTMLPNHE